MVSPSYSSAMFPLLSFLVCYEDEISSDRSGVYSIGPVVALLRFRGLNCVNKQAPHLVVNTGCAHTSVRLLAQLSSVLWINVCLIV